MWCLSPDPPQYTGEATYEVNEIAEAFRIDLTLESSPSVANADFSWFFNGKRLMSGENGAFLGADFIQFQNVSQRIAGSYRVMSSNIAGSGTFAFQLRGR